VVNLALNGPTDSLYIFTITFTKICSARPEKEPLLCPKASRNDQNQPFTPTPIISIPISPKNTLSSPATSKNPTNSKPTNTWLTKEMWPLVICHLVK
jgi:hypothetical protein